MKQNDLSLYRVKYFHIDKRTQEFIDSLDSGLSEIEKARKIREFEDLNWEEIQDANWSENAERFYMDEETDKGEV